MMHMTLTTGNGIMDQAKPRLAKAYEFRSCRGCLTYTYGID